jgi:hypothetical protein
MITQWQSSETIVGRLRIESTRIDPAIAQLRLSSLLTNALSHPTSLPPTAIVFIRKLNDPLPRSLELQRSYIRPPAAWQQALNTRLENLIANAVRPGLGSVPANAQAVIFLDRSELLAALANDWCDDRLATCWWWQSLLRRAKAAQVVKESWQDAPQYVPAAVDKLTTAGKAARFVKTFSDSEACALLVSVARTFALNDLAAVLHELSVARKPFTVDQEQSNLSLPALTKELNHERSEIQSHSNAPWRDWIQTDQLKELGPERQRLLGIAVMLQRVPAKVRTKSFALAVERWSYEKTTAGATSVVREGKKIEGDSPAQTLSGSSTDRNDSSSSTQLKSEMSLSDKSLRGPSPISFDNNPGLSEQATETEETIQFQSANRLKEEYPGGEQLNVSSQPQPPSTAEPLVEGLILESEDTNSNFKGSQTTTRPKAVELYDSPAVELQTETEFGGLFYLINLGIYLGLYGDFTTPAKPGIDVNIWDFVALVGRELIGERVEENPVWTLLQRLSGRTEGEDPGTLQVRVWLDGLMPYICTRLRSALGLTPTEDPGSMVCEQHARITVTPAHIDVFCALADLPIELRIAGLDRDPGWLPGAGRFIHFHFD